MSMFPTFIMPEPNDASINYLAGILGHDVINGVMGSNTPSALDSHVFARMMDVFNHLLLGGGLFIFSILLFVGTMNTAADGQFLGRNWHSVWTPVRLVFGIMLVVPLKTGYCIGQYIILYAIFIGIHFATTVWQHAINDVFNNQDTPPPPTYLTTEIQQVLGQAINNLAVPVILQASGLVGNGSGSSPSTINNGQPIVLSIPATIYQIKDGGLPQEMKTDIMNDFIGKNGQCFSLFSRYSTLCSTVALNAFNTTANGHAVGSDGQISLTVNIGSELPANTDWAKQFAPGMPENPWNPNGQINVYGAYVYNPSKLFSGVTPDSTNPECKNTPDGSGNNDGTQPNCQEQTANQGAQDAYKALTVVFNDAIIAPAQSVVISNGGMSDADAQKFKSLCASKVPMTVPDPANPGKTMSVNASPCSLQFAVESVMSQAKEYARQQALTYASDVGNYDPNDSKAVAPTQASSKPIPFPAGADPTQANPDDVYAVPPQGQADALSKNMYKYWGKDGKVHIGYNLDDYWIADINSEKYIDLQLNNSWWMAGSSYLVLDNILGQNLAWMAQSIQNQLELFNNAMSVNTLDKNLSYQCNGPESFQPDTTHLTSFITPEFCLNYYAQVIERDANLIVKDGIYQIQSMPNDPHINTPTNPAMMASCQIYKEASGATYYSCDIDKLRATQPSRSSVYYNNGNIAVSNWQALIQPYNPVDPSAIVKTSATPQFYQMLVGMPAGLQGPFAVMLSVAQAAGNNPNDDAATRAVKLQNAYQKLYPYLVSLVNLLQYNGLLSGNQIDTALPVNHSINNIFDQLIGGHNNIGNAGQAKSAATSINTVMQQVYNLGVTDNSRGVIAAQFSLIQQAQTAGISMIMACVTSMESVYNAYTATLQGMVDKVNQISGSAAGGSTQAMTFASMIPVVGPIFNTIAENDVRNLQLSIMTTTVTTISNVSIQLMWLPLLVFIMTSLFTAGVQFAILVPLMPYILFWAGQIAWLIGVIEAVVAAPLVMLGLAHPGGHEFMGHTVPAVKMLIGVMFRPVLMVIGLIVGILLTYIVINFSAQGFHTIAAGILNAVPQSEATVQGIMACLLLFIYATFLVMAFQKCFSTIYMIPEQVVQWIGGQAARAGQDELQQVSSAAQQTAQGAGLAGGQALEKGIGAQKDRASSMSDLSSKQMSTQFENNKAWAQGGKQAAGEALEAVKLMA